MSQVMANRSVSTLLVVTLATLMACGSDSPAGPPPDEGDDPVPTTSVAVRDNAFVPMHIAVSPGAEVTWTWEGTQPHDVIWVAADLPDSPTQSGGFHDVTMPAEPGQFEYFCSVHGGPTFGMRGTVTVE